ncbi:hypothetical protein RFI_29789, partial [Reticulomyxa filosa]
YFLENIVMNNKSSTNPCTPFKLSSNFSMLVSSLCLIQKNIDLELNIIVLLPLTMNDEKVINHFILFCYNTGLLKFNYEKLPYSMKDKTWNECKITLPMKISSSFDTNVHVIDGSNANYKIQKMHVNTNVRKLQLFEKRMN